jgi:hypothetical protein
VDQWVWVAVIGGAIFLFWLPVIIAAIRGTEPIGIVILLTLLTPLGGVTWFGAWIAAFMFPRRQPARARRARPYWDDPRYLYGGVPYTGTDAANVTRHQAGARDR